MGWLTGCLYEWYCEKYITAIKCKLMECLSKQVLTYVRVILFFWLTVSQSISSIFFFLSIFYVFGFVWIREVYSLHVYLRLLEKLKPKNGQLDSESVKKIIINSVVYIFLFISYLLCLILFLTYYHFHILHSLSQLITTILKIYLFKSTTDIK